MKKIILLGAAPIDGKTRFPAEGEIEVTPAVADDLVKVGLAKDASLSGKSAHALRQVAADELVDVAPAATKAKIAGAIEAGRAGDAD